MNHERILLGVLLLATVSVACTLESKPSDCPVTTVTLDGGADLSPLQPAGKYVTGAVCEELCGHGLGVCRLVGPTKLTCQPACE